SPGVLPANNVDAPTVAGSLKPPSGRMPAPPAPSPGGETLPQPGELVDAYRVVKLLGKGGMGAVFLARHERTGAEVALKLMLDVTDAKFVERFHQKIEATAKLRHPNVVSIRSSGAWGPRKLPYCVLEFIPGTDLAKQLAAGPLEPRQAFALM